MDSILFMIILCELNKVTVEMMVLRQTCEKNVDKRENIPEDFKDSTRDELQRRTMTTL